MSRVLFVMNSLAVVIVLAVMLWGASIYGQLPQQLPTHWNAAGEADAFGAKSVWTVFGALFIGAASCLLLIGLQLGLNRRKNTTPAEQRVIGLSLSYLSLAMAVLFGWIALLSWYGLQPGPAFIVFTVLLVVPVLIIIAVNMPRLREERAAVTPQAEPALNPKYWVLGGMFYNNPDDRRVIVPRPPHMGVGGTFNLATAGGKLFIALISAVLIASFFLPFLL